MRDKGSVLVSEPTPETADFYSPDTFNVAVLDLTPDGDTLTVSLVGMNSTSQNAAIEYANGPQAHTIFSFQVTAEDHEKPVITTCATDKTVIAPCPASVPLPDSTGEVVATDCGTLNVTQTPPPGTSVGVGNTTVTLHVADDSGNESTCTATVRVLYNWSGFFQPVDNVPTYNRVNAGKAI